MSRKKLSHRDRKKGGPPRRRTTKWIYVGLSLLVGLVSLWFGVSLARGNRATAAVDTGSLTPGLGASDEAATAPRGEGVVLAPASALTDRVATAPPVVREAYRFAIANPDLLSKMPCYCGCGQVGHTSNLDCFIDRFEPDGRPVFDDHALGCGICVDIARDVLRMARRGTSASEIRVAIDRQYSQYGLPTDTQLPE